MKRISTKRILLTVTLTVILLFVFAVAYAYKQSGTPQNQPYQYAYMADTCQKGIESYTKMQKEINDESDVLANQASSDATATTAQANAYASDNDASYKEALTDISSAYDQGLISYAEWSKRVDALGALPTYSAQAQATATASASQILAVAIEKLKVNKQSLQKVNDNINKLTACINTANIYHDFNSTQVAELETIVTNSTVRP